MPLCPSDRNVEADRFCCTCHFGSVEALRYITTDSIRHIQGRNDVSALALGSARVGFPSFTTWRRRIRFRYPNQQQSLWPLRKPETVEQNTKKMHSRLGDVQPALLIVRNDTHKHASLLVLAKDSRLLRKHALYAKQSRMYICIWLKLLKVWCMASQIKGYQVEPGQLYSMDEKGLLMGKTSKTHSSSAG